MRTFILSLLVFMACAGGTDPLQASTPQAFDGFTGTILVENPTAPSIVTRNSPLWRSTQEAVDEITTAFVNTDAAPIRQRWFPDNLVSTWGSTVQEQEKRISEFIPPQRVSIIRAFGVQPPVVRSIEEGYSGSLEVRIAACDDCELSPKTIHMWRDPTDGRVYWSGLKTARHDPADKSVLAKNLQTVTNWTMRNYSFTTNHRLSTGFRSHLTGTGFTLANPGAPMNGLGSCVLQWWSTPANTYAWMNPPALQVNNFGGNYTVGLLTPNSTAAACDASHTRSSQCCYWSFFGDEFTWDSTSDGNPAALPFCNAGSCPTGF